MADFFASSWFWWAFALALFAAEALAPGAFMLWLGFAAAGVGLVTIVFADLALWIEWVLFSLLALVSVWLGWRWRRGRAETPTDQPLLNRRAQQYVGRVVSLESAIVNGFGRAHVGDTLWPVAGPDLPAGTRVRVTGSDGSRLRVEAVE